MECVGCVQVRAPAQHAHPPTHPRAPRPVLLPQWWAPAMTPGREYVEITNEVGGGGGGGWVGEWVAER